MTSRRQLRELGIPPSKVRLVDVLWEAADSTLQHPVRSLLTAVGAILGAGAFVAALGVSSTVSRQVSDDFDAYRATEVVVEGETETAGTTWLEPERIRRVTGLSGVVGAGRLRIAKELTIRRGIESASPATNVDVLGADPGALSVIGPVTVSGRAYDDYHEATAEPVVMLSVPVARTLGITQPGGAVFIGDTALTVIGIYTDVQRESEALLGALVPYRVLTETTTSGTDTVLIETAPGAAATIARQAPLALLPEAPELLVPVAPPDPENFRRGVESNVTRLSLLVSAIAFALGMVSIANAATAGIMARIPEIGLRRAVGARPRHIFLQLLAETSLLGTVGGIVGASLGTMVTVGIALWNGWEPILDVRLAVVAALAGAIAGLAAGFVPAIRAVRIQPADAIKR